MNRQESNTSSVNRYTKIRTSVGAFFETLEKYAAQFFGDGSSPFFLTGALILGFLIVSAVTGLFLLLSYSPTPEHATESVRFITFEMRFGSIMRGVHRTSADLLILSILFHMLRNWATGRYIGARSRNWIIGLFALPLIGVIGWSGYVLPWDERAMVLLAWGRDISHGADSWPILGWLKPGTLISWPVFSVHNEADQLMRMFSLHVGGAFLTIFLTFLHLKNVTPSKSRLPVSVWACVILLLLLVSAILPFERELLNPLNPFNPVTSVKIDGIVSFPLLFYPGLGGPVLAALMLIVWILLAWLPRFERDEKSTAVVIETECRGCRLCLNDCPYNAIEMIVYPHPENIKSKKEHEIASVTASRCTSCGICVGSCQFDAIELPGLTSTEILEDINRVLVEETESEPEQEETFQSDVEAPEILNEDLL